MASGGFFDLTITGDEAIVANAARIAGSLEDLAPLAIERSAAIAIQLMQRLAPVKTGKLKRSIRFAMGNGGAARTSVRRSGSLGKTRVVGYILAGDDTTIVGGSRGAKKGGGRRWQNARLQEFGTQSMPAKPFFYPAWRASKQKVKAQIARELRKAFNAANAQPMELAA
jgi:HK97 gp10 family phage protein